MISFDPLQHPSGAMRGIHAIEASAGTGKTYSITIIWLRLLLEHGVPVGEILVSTFTKAATGELRERLLAGLEEAAAALVAAVKTAPQGGDSQSENSQGPGSQVIAACLDKNIDPVTMLQRLAQARSDFDLAPISTLHGFCQRVLRDHSFDVDADPAAEPQPDLGTIVDDVAEALIIELMHEEKLAALGNNPVVLVRQLAHKIASNPDLSRNDIFPHHADPADLEAQLQTTAHDLLPFREAWKTGRTQ